MKPIILITDFGADSEYVGALKIIAHSVCAELKVIDGCHTIEPQNVAHASAVLRQMLTISPPAVFVVVVDPGVGSNRPIVAVEAEGYQFVGPDNGIFNFLVDQSSHATVYQLENPYWRRSNVSSTFHGRDLMMPAAARLAMGVAAEEAGPKVSFTAKDALPPPKREHERIIGNIIHSDTFGNMMTNIPYRLFSDWLASDGFSALVGPHRIEKYVDHYAALTGSRVALVTSSSGNLEFAVRNGSAKACLELKSGDVVTLVRNK